MRQQYHFRPSPNGFFAWDVNRLVELSSALEVISISLSQIVELDECYWFDTGTTPTCRRIAEHFKLMLEADLRYPIILCAAGRIMDGMHRVTKALAEGRLDTHCVRFDSTPQPDFIDVQPEDLPY